MKANGKSTRFHERTKLEIPLEVVYRENSEIVWREQTQTEEITVCGGGFTLSHPLEPKRLVHLKMPLPKNFRLFDFGKYEYEIWGVVRYVRLIQFKIADRISLKVGAALTGGAPPKSFLQDPTTLYDLKPVLRNQSLWELRELPRKTGRYARAIEDRTKIEMKVIVETIGGDGRIIQRMFAETENISESGIALTIALTAPTPAYVLVNFPEQNLRIFSKVRGVQRLPSNNLQRLHLEFLSGKWLV